MNIGVYVAFAKAYMPSL